MRGMTRARFSMEHLLGNWIYALFTYLQCPVMSGIEVLVFLLLE
jgi:hypothetical protein